MIDAENCKEGDEVVYIGSFDEQVSWGGCDDPRKVLTEGKNILLQILKHIAGTPRFQLKDPPDNFQAQRLILSKRKKNLKHLQPNKSTATTFLD